MSKETRDRIIKGYMKNHIEEHKLVLSPSLRLQVEIVAEELGIPYHEAAEIMERVIREEVEKVIKIIKTESQKRQRQIIE